jgi:hypothetical protein
MTQRVVSLALQLSAWRGAGKQRKLQPLAPRAVHFGSFRFRPAFANVPHSMMESQLLCLFRRMERGA